MRCTRCERRAKRLRIGRGPNGRLLFDWCDDCLAEVHSQALRGGLDEIDFDPPRRSRRTEAEARAGGLRAVGLFLVAWGLVLESVGASSWLGGQSSDAGFGPTGTGRLQVFSAAGGVLAIAGAWVGLTSVDRAARRRSVARAIEAVSIGLGLGVLILGILFHEPRRDPWIVAVVALACLAIWTVRRWAGTNGLTRRALRTGRGSQ